MSGRCIGRDCPYPAGSLCARYPCAGKSSFTPDHMRAMWKAGDPMSMIAAKAYRELGWSKEQTREAVLAASGEAA